MSAPHAHGAEVLIPTPSTVASTFENSKQPSQTQIPEASSPNHKLGCAAGYMFEGLGQDSGFWGFGLHSLLQHLYNKVPVLVDQLSNG